MSRVSCLVKNRWPRLAVALPRNAGGTVNLAFVCATEQASLDMRNGSTLLMLCRPGQKKKTEGLQYQQVPYEPREKPCFVSRVS